jgi:Transglycosylase SLT domain
MIMADTVTSGEVLNALLLSGLMGLLGQGVRAAVGLKSSNRLSAGEPNQQTAFSAAYFTLSLMIGFIAGVLAGLVVGVQGLLKIDPDNIKALLAIAASGYAGADFIENSLSIIIPGGGAQKPQTTPDTDHPPGAQVNMTAALTAHTSALTDAVQQLTTVSQQISSVASGSVPQFVTEAVPLISPSELRRDMAEATKYLKAIQEAAEKCVLAPSLICAIGSRESNWGQGSDMHPKGPAGTGDWARRDPARWGYPMPPDGLGWGRGLMQVDYAQSDFGKTGNWQDPAANVLFGAEELAGNIQYFKSHPHGDADPLRAAIAAYNCGRGNVNRAITSNVDVDAFTTGHNYSRDVTARAAWFKANGFDDLPAAA